jgi:hypothetical protein
VNCGACRCSISEPGRCRSREPSKIGPNRRRGVADSGDETNALVVDHRLT